MSKVAIHTILQKICCFNCGYTKNLSEVLPMNVGPFSDLMIQLTKDHKYCLESEEGSKLKDKATKASRDFDNKKEQFSFDEKYYKYALSLWGKEAQVKQAVEELAELVVALNHYDRGRVVFQEVLEEIADVEILIAQMKVIFTESKKSYPVESGWKTVNSMLDCNKLSIALLTTRSGNEVNFNNIEASIKDQLTVCHPGVFRKIKNEKLAKFTKAVDKVLVLEKAVEV